MASAQMQSILDALHGPIQIVLLEVCDRCASVEAKHKSLLAVDVAGYPD